MSAVRDQSQNTKFIFANFYHLYLQGKLASGKPDPLAKGLVLKAGQKDSLESVPELAQIRVVSAKQSEDTKNFAMANDNSRKNLSDSLKSIREARKRLSFLMQEVDDILKRS